MTKGVGPSYISVGGNVGGSVVTVGDSNRQSVTNSGGSGERSEVTESLSAIRKALDTLSGLYADNARRTVDQVIEAAEKSEPDKRSIGDLLEMALTAAKKTSEFSTVAAGLMPHVERVAQWLGGECSRLLTLT